MTDRQIQEQAYTYFLAEAPELLQTIEQELITLPTEHTTPKVHTLMRALHTLKGAAAMVGLESIAHLAHELENIVRVFYNLEVEIAPDIQSWLLAGYSALYSLLDVQITGQPIEESEIYEGFQQTIGQLQERLGEHLGVEVELPSSFELGFDFVATIFESDIKEQIERIELALTRSDLTLLSTTLNFTVDICTGLAESAELDGLLGIAKAIGAAIVQHPDRLEEIAHVAIANLEFARTEVLAGNRDRGGEILPELAVLSGLELNPDDESEFSVAEEDITGELDPPASTLVTPGVREESKSGESEEDITGDLDTNLPSVAADLVNPDLAESILRKQELIEFRGFLTSNRFRSRQPLAIATQDFLVDLIRLSWDWFEQCVDTHPSKLDLDLLIAAEGLPDLDYIDRWIDLLLSQLRAETDSQSLEAYRRSCLYQIVFAVAKYLADLDPKARISSEFLDRLRDRLQTTVTLAKELPPITANEKAWLDLITLPHNWPSLSTTKHQPTASSSDDELLKQIWGQSQLLEGKLQQKNSLQHLSGSGIEPETRLVGVATLSNLSHLCRDQFLHAQQLQSLLVELTDRWLQLQPDGNPHPRSTPEEVRSRLDLATQAVEQIQYLLDRQQQLLNHLDPLAIPRSEIINN
jgi:two-component system, chemotaxis family, sensor histidine kinase and response regulator PixL